MEKLTKDDVEQRMQAFPEWTLSGESLQRTFALPDFSASMSFVGRVAELAEQMQHHPDILIRYNKVTLTLTTHDAGGITEKDFAFAEEIAGAAAPA